MPATSILLGITLVCLCLAPILAAPADAGTDGSFSISYGRKFLSDDWDVADVQDVLALSLCIGGDTWPVRIMFERFITVDMQIFDVESTDELNLGLRHYWNLRANEDIRPFVSAGVVHITGFVGTYINETVYSADDSATGFYLDGGLQYHFSPTSTCLAPPAIRRRILAAWPSAAPTFWQASVTTGNSATPQGA